MMRGASGDECGNLLEQEYNRPARGRRVEKAPGSDFNFLLKLQIAAGRFMVKSVLSITHILPYNDVRVCVILKVLIFYI
jgi:hypothetical protein